MVSYDACAALGVANVLALAYLPDGSGVIAGLAGAVAKLLDPNDAHEARTFMGHSGAINAVAVSTDGTTLVTASDDHTVKLWRVSDAALLATLTGPQDPLLSVAVSPDGTRVAAGATNGEVFLWERSTGNLIQSAADHTNEVGGVGFAAGGGRVFTASKDGSVRVYSGVDLSAMGAPIQGAGWWTAFAVSADGAHVGVGDVGGGVAFLRASDGVVEARASAEFRVDSIALAPDGSIAYATNPGGSVYAIHLDGSPRQLLVAPIGADSRRLALSPDGTSLFLSSGWALWMIDTAGQSRHDPVQQGPFPRSVAFWPDSSRLLIGGDFGMVVRALPSGDLTQAPDWGQFAERYNGVAVAPDGTQFASAEEGGNVRLWSSSSWEPTLVLGTATTSAYRVAFSPDGRLVAAVGRGIGNIYTVASGEYLRGLAPGGDDQSIEFSRDGSLIAVGSENRALVILRTADWSSVTIDSAHSPIVYDVAFAPDGTQLFSAGDSRVTAWQLADLTTRRNLVDDDTYQAITVAVHPDGAFLVAGGSDGELRRWSLPDLTPLPSLPAHGSGVVTARFSPNGEMMAVAYADGTTWLWCRD